MGELHLEVIISRMQREFNTHVNVGKPQVVYRETIETEAEGNAFSTRKSPGIASSANDPASETVAEGLERGLFTVQRRNHTGNFIPAIEKGVMESLESGALMGYPVVDVEAMLVGGTFRESQGTDWLTTSPPPWPAARRCATGSPFFWIRS